MYSNLFCKPNRSQTSCVQGMKSVRRSYCFMCFQLSPAVKAREYIEATRGALCIYSFHEWLASRMSWTASMS